MNVRRLYELGGTATTKQIDDGSGATATHGLAYAKFFGLVSGGGKQGRNKVATWSLTPLGEAWALNLVEDRHHKHAGVKTWFAPTWLSALPRGVRLNQNRPEA
jgi:hypothetical protein